jgi:TRAP-type uncharacterized transport system fused permease subunit
VLVEGRDAQQVCTVLLAGLAWLLPLLLLLSLLLVLRAAAAAAAAAAALRAAQLLLPVLCMLLVQKHGIGSQQLQEHARYCRIMQHLVQVLHSFIRQLRCGAISQLAAGTHEAACCFLQREVAYVHPLDLAVGIICVRPQGQQKWAAALQLLQ